MNKEFAIITMPCHVLQLPRRNWMLIECIAANGDIIALHSFEMQILTLTV